eukprot:7171227-Pyramimonas_sp.AAC.1
MRPPPLQLGPWTPAAVHLAQFVTRDPSLTVRGPIRAPGGQRRAESLPEPGTSNLPARPAGRNQCWATSDIEAASSSGELENMTLDG